MKKKSYFITQLNPYNKIPEGIHIQCICMLHYVSPTCHNVQFLSTSGSLMYSEMYGAGIELGYAKGMTSALGGSVNTPYSLIIYAIAFTQTFISVMLILCQLFRDIKYFQQNITKYKNREKALEEEVRFLRWRVRKGDGRLINNGRRSVTRDSSSRSSANRNSSKDMNGTGNRGPTPKEKITVDELLARSSQSADNKLRHSSVDVRPEDRDRGHHVDVTDSRDVPTVKDFNVQRSKSFSVDTEDETHPRYYHSTNNRPPRPSYSLRPLAGNLRLNDVNSNVDDLPIRNTHVNGYDTVPRVGRRAKETTSPTSLTPGAGSERFSLETLELESLSPQQNKVTNATGTQTAKEQSKNSEKVEKDLDEMKKTLAETYSILGQLRSRRENAQNKRKQGKETQDTSIDTQPLLSPKGDNINAKTPNNYARNKPIRRNLLLSTEDAESDSENSTSPLVPPTTSS